MRLAADDEKIKGEHGQQADQGGSPDPKGNRHAIPPAD
jgi:hypothetical protein